MSRILDIPTKLIIKNYDIFFNFFYLNIKADFQESIFPQPLKYTDVKRVFQKNY